MKVKEHKNQVIESANSLIHGADADKAKSIYIDFYTDFDKTLSKDELEILSHSMTSEHYCSISKANYYRKVKCR